MKLNQVIAIEKSIKSKVKSEETELYKAIQKEALFNGFSKEYSSKKENGEQYPPEKKLVSFTVHNTLKKLGDLLSNYWDIEAQKDFANCTARADLVVDGETLLTSVPATFFLTLEKELVDLHTFASNLPVLDPAEDWKFDTSSGLHRTDESQTFRTKKVQTPLVLYPATDKHPAQTQLITEDIVEGAWRLTKLSGAVTVPEKARLVERIEMVQKSVKLAREQANMVEAPVVNVGRKLLDWIMK